MYVGAVGDPVAIPAECAPGPGVLLPPALAPILVVPGALLPAIKPGGLVLPAIVSNALTLPDVVVGALVVMPFCHMMEEVTFAS